MTEHSPYATIEEAAAFFKVSQSTLRSWLRRGLIPPTTYFKVGSVYRIRLPDAEAALMAAPDAEYEITEEDNE